VRLELLTKNPVWIASKQLTIVINFHQDLTASMHSNFFQGQTDRGLIYEPTHSKENWLLYKEEEEEEGEENIEN
jgi:hypothetical protein